MGWLTNQYLRRQKAEDTDNMATNWARRARTHAHFRSLSRCQNGCLGYCGRRHISIRLNKPSGTRGCFQPSTGDWIIPSDVNQQQAKSDNEVDLINPMVLMLTCLINHRAYQVVYLLVPVMQPTVVSQIHSDRRWEKADPGSAGGPGRSYGGMSTRMQNSPHGREDSEQEDAKWPL